MFAGGVRRPALHCSGEGARTGPSRPSALEVNRGSACRTYIGIDIVKLRNALADNGRGGEVRFFGEIDASDVSTRVLPRPASGCDTPW